MKYAGIRVFAEFSKLSPHSFVLIYILAKLHARGTFLPLSLPLPSRPGSGLKQRVTRVILGDARERFIVQVAVSKPCSIKGSLELQSLD